MPQIPLEEPTTRIAINLFTKDIAYLKRKHLYYQVLIREIIHTYCRKQQVMDDIYDRRHNPTNPRPLPQGDLLPRHRPRDEVD